VPVVTLRDVPFNVNLLTAISRHCCKVHRLKACWFKFFLQIFAVKYLCDDSSDTLSAVVTVAAGVGQRRAS
jgi:hypothetical protein